MAGRKKDPRRDREDDFEVGREIEAAARRAGVDLATVRERLRMTPAGRLSANTRAWRMVVLFRRAGGRTCSDSPRL